MSKYVGELPTLRALRAVRFTQIFIGKIILVLGFVALTSGFIVSGGLFRDREIWSGLAHYIKGGMFFWYRMLTLGRYLGAFQEFGWAWNIRPGRHLVAPWKSRMPSAELMESFVIWLYGASNVFLEHLNSVNGEWLVSDLEHVSIAILFFGGGLLGMVIECDWLWDLINASNALQRSKDE